MENGLFIALGVIMISVIIAMLNMAVNITKSLICVINNLI